jgi:predicted dehydrogenase
MQTNHPAMPQSLDRRKFLLGAGTLGLGAAVLPAGRLFAAKSGTRKVRHACIGIGGMGRADFSQFVRHPSVEIVAVCDIDVSRSQAVRAKVPGAKYYQDWRELLANEKIDSVNVAVPDHTHAAITMTALSLGRHVYCQKPLTHDIYEARQIGAKAAESGLVTQMGTQLTSKIAERIAVEWIRDGAIGKVKEVFLWSNKPAEKYRPKGPRPKGRDPVPEGLDWDGWTGTAPMRPYVKGVYHPTWWRGWQDFGCGWLGDMGCHIMDMPFRSLGLGMPLSVSAEVEPEWANDPARRVETFPRWQIVEYLYPGSDLTAEDTVKLTWSDGGKYPDDKLRAHIDGKPWPTQGALLLGEKGALMMEHGSTPRLYPRKNFAGTKAPKLPPQNHYHQFIDAILGKNGGKTHSPFPYAAHLTEMVLIGTIALRFPNQKLKWDAAKMRFADVPEANRFVRRDYRDGWKVGGL